MHKYWAATVIGALFLGCAHAGTEPPAASLAHLSMAQKQSLVLAYQEGAHYQLGLTFAAVVWLESDACREMHGDHGRAYGCSQIHEVAVAAVTGAKIPTWELDLRALSDINMGIGARYLDLCMQRFGWPAGIGCYNVGMTNADRMGRRKLDDLPYTREVLRRRKLLESLPVDNE